MTHVRKPLVGMIVCAAIVAQPAQAAADQAPVSVRDLVGARGSSGETALETRGFSYIGGGTRDDRKIAYWWNANNKECIRVATFDGRYETITAAPKSDCNQKGGSNDAAAVAAVGAMALLGAIALTHKSHDHDKYSHYGDANSEAQYERGYRDGLYNHSYHNYDRSQAYTSGYEGGVRARGYETGYRNDNHFGGGYTAHVSLRDLEGRDRSYAKAQLASRGLERRDSKKTDDGRYATYRRAASRQCVIVTSRGAPSTRLSMHRRAPAATNVA